MKIENTRYAHSRRINREKPPLRYDNLYCWRRLLDCAITPRIKQNAVVFEDCVTRTEVSENNAKRMFSRVSLPDNNTSRNQTKYDRNVCSVRNTCVCSVIMSRELPVVNDVRSVVQRNVFARPSQLLTTTSGMEYPSPRHNTTNTSFETCLFLITPYRTGVGRPLTIIVSCSGRATVVCMWSVDENRVHNADTFEKHGRSATR